MRRFLLSCLLLALAPVAPDAAAQEVARVSVEQENFRRSPGGSGTILATVNQGTDLPILERQGNWRRVWLKGYVWAPSVGPTDRDGADLVVTRDGGENLRDVPNGRVAARLREGMLLERVGQAGNWYQVERQGWIWAPSVIERGGSGEAAAGEESAPADAPAGEGGEAAPSEAGAGGGSPDAVERMVVEGGAATLHLTPDGDTVARALDGTHVEITGREGDWTRVRVEGWVPTATLVSPDSAAVTPDLTVAALRAEPERYEGRRVRWTLRFISLERAEQEREDFYEGEPFVLARPTGSSEEGFVYLAVPADLLSRVKGLEPLQTIEVMARVRTGRSALMGVPVLELLTLY